jgi:DNA-binding SARP family transcriptional activator
MRYEVLGPMRMFDGEDYWTIGTRKLETLLGVLLLRADHVVSIDQLTDEIWRDKRPVRAMAGIHGYVSQLRKHFRDHGDPDGPIVTQPAGYLLRSGGDQIDTKVFLGLVAQARGHRRERQFEQAAECLGDAQALWRGPLLGDVRGGPIIKGYTSWLIEAWIECAELHVDVQLELGLHREVLGMLHSAVAEHPLRENFYRQLMVALYRSGFRAEALKVYHTARSRLRRELGLEPGRELRVLQQQILSADPRLDLVSAAA